jgi:hypothetical protein
MPNFRIFEDRDGDPWIEFPPGSRQLFSLEEKVLRRMAEKNTPFPLPDAAENYGPLKELA